MWQLIDFYDKNFLEGFDDLTISEREVAILNTLKELAKKTGCEYGVAHNANGFCDPFTSDYENRVAIPANVLIGDDVRLYHCHTNNTCLSRDDLTLMTNPIVQRITVITPIGIVFSAMRGNGFTPTKIEFDDFAERIHAEANFIVMERDGFYDWSIEKRQHEAIKEEAYRITRYFGWRIEGGML